MSPERIATIWGIIFGLLLIIGIWEVANIKPMKGDWKDVVLIEKEQGYNSWVKQLERKRERGR